MSEEDLQIKSYLFKKKKKMWPELKIELRLSQDSDVQANQDTNNDIDAK